MRRHATLGFALLLLGLLALSAPAIGAGTAPIYLPIFYTVATPTATPSPTPTRTPTATPRASYDVLVAPWCSNFDAEGDDRQNLNDEYVCFQNHDTVAVDMSGWFVQDRVRTTYNFTPFTLGVGAHVRLHTGSDYDTDTDLYWGRGAPVWNNDGDTVYLYDRRWNLVDQYDY